MAEPQTIGYDSSTGRQVSILALEAIQTSFTWSECEGEQFVCLCAMDARSISDEQISALCSRLIQLGCAYLCSWGPDCERVHDIMDRTVIGSDPPKTYLGCLMTTCHAKESLAEAVDYFLTCTVPDGYYSPNGCTKALAVAVGSGLWATQIKQHVRASISS